jgi:glycosyltransferase involved in cell wall biosynthesis
VEQPKRLRILLNSNALWTPSGYAQQVAELAPLIREAGYPIALSNFFGQMGGKFMLDGMVQYPVVNHTYGSDAMVMHGNDFSADVVFSLQDTWVLNPHDLANVRRWIPITPVDHDPVPPGVISNLRFAYRVVSIAQHGKKELASKGIASTYIQHTVNTEIFKPLNKPERKQKANLPPDSFVVGMVAANKDNPPRKSFQEVIDAFAMLLTKEPKALLYIHSNPEFPGGFNFKQYAEFLGIGNRLIYPDMYEMNFNTPKESMALIYNCFDVLVAPSISEGFGIPIIEAQACGVPVVVNDFTSMPELIKAGETGELCTVAGKLFSTQGSYMARPDTKSIFEGILRIKQRDAGKTRDAARKWIVQNYDSKKVFKEKWEPFLAQLEKEVYGDAPLDKTLPPQQ